MSKVNAMQAMREARYAARQTSSARQGSAPKSPLLPASASMNGPARSKPVDADDAFEIPKDLDQPVALTLVAGSPDIMASGAKVESMPEAICGHRSMNNRICQRPAGHPEKNHRYS